MISKLSTWTVAVASALVIAAPAQAQWHVNGVAVAEVDTKNTLLLLAGLGASPAGRGVKPMIGVQGYHLGYDVGSTRTNVFTVKPYVGIGDDYGKGEVYGNVGYAFSSKDTPVATTSTNDIGNGVVVAGGWDHWGDGIWGHQILGSYNFDTEGFWGRGRETKRIAAGSNGSQRRLGAEVAFLSGKGYSAWQPGAVMEIHNGKGSILGLGAGMKFFGNGGGNAVYFKVEGVFPVVR